MGTAGAIVTVTVALTRRNLSTLFNDDKAGVIGGKVENGDVIEGEEEEAPKKKVLPWQRNVKKGKKAAALKKTLNKKAAKPQLKFQQNTHNGKCQTKKMKMKILQGLNQNLQLMMTIAIGINKCSKDIFLHLVLPIPLSLFFYASFFHHYLCFSSLLVQVYSFVFVTRCYSLKNRLLLNWQPITSLGLWVDGKDCNIFIVAF